MYVKETYVYQLRAKFKEIHWYLVPQSSKNLQNCQNFQLHFWKFWTTDKNENGIVGLALEAESNRLQF